MMNQKGCDQNEQNKTKRNLSVELGFELGTYQMQICSITTDLTHLVTFM
jgi:hypothetical protein